MQPKRMHIRKHRKTTRQFQEDVPNTVVSYLDVDDAGDSDVSKDFNNPKF